MHEELTVQDILAQRPSLRDRAREAAAVAKKAEEQRRRDEEQDLCIESVAWVREHLGCSAAEVEDMDFLRGPYDSGGSRRQVTFKIDGIQFRGHFDNKTVAEYTENGDKKAIKERMLEVRVLSGSGNTWTEVTDLISLGKVIS